MLSVVLIFKSNISISISISILLFIHGCAVLDPGGHEEKWQKRDWPMARNPVSHVFLGNCLPPMKRFNGRRVNTGQGHTMVVIRHQLGGSVM